MFTSLLCTRPRKFLCADSVGVYLGGVTIYQVLGLEWYGACSRKLVIRPPSIGRWVSLAIISLISVTITGISYLGLYSLDPISAEQAEHRITIFFGYVWPACNVKSRLNWIIFIFTNTLHEYCFVETDVVFADGLRNWSCKCCRAQKREQANPANNSFEGHANNLGFRVCGWALRYQ
jgi:hypothetical protein